MNVLFSLVCALFKNVITISGYLAMELRKYDHTKKHTQPKHTDRLVTEVHQVCHKLNVGRGGALVCNIAYFRLT